ncbi:MAG: methyltransferase domain-containing protein [Myxococcales bacterium]|nr:methyltransferase domain-containing protein [Myxococcales bacterium]
MPSTPLSPEADRPKRLEGHRLFLLDFLRRPREVASVIPSSRFLERRIVRAAEVDVAKTVVELGPGTGGTSRAFLRAMAPDTRLLCIEINDRFAEHLERELDDPRVIVHRGDARDLRAILDTYELPSPDAVLSGIPFSTIPQEVGLGILRSVHEALVPGGRFVAYQVRDRVEVLGRTIFGPAEAVTEYRNVPPARVFTWRKARNGCADAS